jgi:ferredoxin
MLEVCQAKGASLVNFEAGGWVPRSVDGRSYKIANAVLEFDKIVNLPKLKTHILTLITAGIKNMFGCIPGFGKSALHLANPRPKDMSKVIVDVFSIVKPWVTLVDAVDVMEGNGPSSGSIRHLGIVAASTDCVALDTVLATIVGIDPARVPTTREAWERELGEGSMGGISLSGVNLEDVRPRDFAVPANWKFALLPGVLGRLVANLVWVKPEVIPDDCVGCGECVAMCPADAIEMDGERAVIDHERCTSCLCCHEACVRGAIDARMSRLARLIA